MTIKSTESEVKTSEDNAKRAPLSLRRETVRGMSVRTAVKTGTCFNTCGIASCGTSNGRNPCGHTCFGTRI